MPAKKKSVTYDHLAHLLMTKKFWITALMFGLPWTVIMVVYFSIAKGGITVNTLGITVAAGLAGGLAFAGLMQFLAKSLSGSIVIETAEGENIIKSGGANHFVEKEGVGGKLVLTDQRLIFKSHKYNVHKHQQTIDLNRITGIEVVRTFGILENGLILELRNGEKHKFIVDDPRDWLEQIKGQQSQFAYAD